MRKLSLILLLALLYCIPSHGATISFAPSSAGSNNGTSCGNAYAWTDGTHGINTTASQVAGNILTLCSGTYPCSAPGAIGVNIVASGSSGNPITIQFQSGAKLSCSSYWGADPVSAGNAAAIYCSGKSYIVVDGQNVGIIENTGNGSPPKANAQGTEAILFQSCPHSEIKGVIVQTMYVHVAGSADVGNTTGCIGAGSSDFVLIHDNTVSQCYAGIGLGYSPGGGGSITSASIYGNHINITCHGINVGDSNGGASADGIKIYGNTVGPDFNTWASSSGNCHQDGMLILAANNTSSLTGLSVYNNDVSASTCPAPGGNFTSLFNISAINGGTMSGIQLFNNIMHNTTTTGGCQMQAFITFGPGVTSTVLVANNTADFNSVSNSSGASNNFLLESGTISGQTVENNAIVNFAHCGGAYVVTANTNDFKNAFTAIDYNDYFNQGCKWGHDDINGQDYGTFLNWQTPSGVNAYPGFDAHGIGNGNPLFNSSYVPQTGSAVINAGTNLTSLSITALDADAAGNGNCRPSSGNWGIGALCFGSEPTVATPTFSPGGGIYSSTQSVTITSATGGATFCYTSDGSTPTGNGAGACTHGTTYSGAISVPATITLKAIGTESGFADSGVGSASYTIGAVPVPAPNPQMLLSQRPQPASRLEASLR